MKVMVKAHLYGAAKIQRIFGGLRDDRGDVPGWVLVVLMTAGMVTGIWALAGPRLSAMLVNSLDAVSAPR